MGISEEPTKVDKRGRVNFKNLTILEMPILDYHKHLEKKIAALLPISLPCFYSRDTKQNKTVVREVGNKGLKCLEWVDNETHFLACRLLNYSRKKKKSGVLIIT